jgi:hypothetical protein
MPMHVVARGVLLAGCSVPSLTLGCRFLWGGRQRPGLLVPCCIPINSVPLLLSHARPISDLGLLGALVGLCLGCAKLAIAICPLIWSGRHHADTSRRGRVEG